MPGVDHNKITGRGGSARGFTRSPGLRRLLGLREGLGAWALPVGRIGPVRIYLHAIVLVWIGAEIAAWSRASWLRDTPRDVALAWWGHLAICVAFILFMALLHEMGRIVWRRIGAGRTASADPAIVLWPLGGLTPAEPVLCARPVLAEAGGLLTTIIAGSGCLAWAVAVGVPLDLTSAGPMWPVDVAARLTHPVQVAAFWSLHAAVVVTAVNILPAPSFDGGRMLEVWLSQRRGWMEAGLAAARIGLLVGIAVMTLGAIMGWSRFMAIGVVAAMASVVWQRRIESRGLIDSPGAPTEPPAPLHPATDRLAPTPARQEIPPEADDAARQSSIHAAGRDGPGRSRRGDSAPAATRSPARRPGDEKPVGGDDESVSADALAAQLEDLLLDEVLAKLSREGNAGLTDADREVLRRATERRRRG